MASISRTTKSVIESFIPAWSELPAFSEGGRRLGVV